MNEIVVLGNLGRPVGVNGWIRLNSFTETRENILDYKPWLLKRNNAWDKAPIEDIKVQSKGILVKLHGVNTPEAARGFTHCEIGVERQVLPTLPAGEYYWDDLIGLSVINQDNIQLGNVVQMLETGANDVLIVKGDKAHLIPYIFDTFIKSIDLNKKQILVNWDPDF